MSVKIEVREGESLGAALSRLRGEVHRAYRRKFSARRLGAYEKPSYLKRKRRPVGIDLARQMAREEVFQKSRQPFKSTRRWWGQG